MKTEIFGLAFGLAFVMVVAIGATVLPAMAATEGASTGSFDLGNEAPTVTSIALFESDGETPETAMDPTTEYVVKIEVADTNTLDDLSEIEVIIRTTGTSADDVNDQATYKWTNGATPVWAKVGPTGLWSIVATSTWPDPLTATTGTWILHFKPGPVARAGTGNWEIYAKATDKADPGLTGARTTTAKYDMNWRGEISVVTGEDEYSFGSIGLSNTDKAITTPGDGKIDVTAISNGDYELDSLTTTTWSCSDPVDLATLDVTGTGACSNAGEFALKNSDNVATGTYVSTSSLVIPGYGDDETITESENGENKGIYQWLNVASSGLLPGTYGGTYTVQIATR